jgi:hypothetical protein
MIEALGYGEIIGAKVLLLGCRLSATAMNIRLILIASLLVGCSSLLPSGKETAVTPWKTFEEAKASYDKIIPYESDMTTVCDLGFDPYKTPNVKILNHAQVVQTVVPSAVQDDGMIPPGVLDCAKAQEACQGFYMEPNKISRQRVGNFWLDFLNFKRETVTSGWRFGALIVIVDGRVVYKQWSGSPNILEENSQRNPLGPLQGSGPSAAASYVLP